MGERVVTFDVLGRNGMLGAVVHRRWQELGGSIGARPRYIVECSGSDDPTLACILGQQAQLILPSTDAIDEDTPYARGKRRMEALPFMPVVIRAGIVDLRKPNDYANWLCNPLTPLEWADLAWQVKDDPGLHVDGREPMTRYDLGVLIAEVFGTEPPRRAWHEVPLGRVQPHGERVPMREALEGYREWLSRS